MQRDPWSKEQLRFERRLENYWPPAERRNPDPLVFWGIALIALACVLGILIWE